MQQQMRASVLQYLKDTPAAVELLSWVITLLLAFMLIRMTMGKVIRERKRYLQYSQKIENEIRKTTCTHLFYSKSIPQSKMMKLSSMAILLIILAVILSLCLMNMTFFFDGRDATDVSCSTTTDSVWLRLFGPLLGGILLLMILAVCVFVIWALGKIKKGKICKNIIPMRVRVIKNKGER